MTQDKQEDIELREKIQILMINFERESGQGSVDRKIGHLNEAMALFQRYTQQREVEFLQHIYVDYDERKLRYVDGVRLLTVDERIAELQGGSLEDEAA